jgi:hypothetical protein
LNDELQNAAAAAAAAGSFDARARGEAVASSEHGARVSAE